MPWRTILKTGMQTLKRKLDGISMQPNYEYIWAIRGYDKVIEKAHEMIQRSEIELYVRLFPKAGYILEKVLKSAETRGVNIRYIAMGDMPLNFEVQVIHPESEKLLDTIGGRSFDIISDRKEALVGIFEKGKEETSPINWTKNRWVVIANRDSLKHDFYHYFLEKTYDRQQQLSAREKTIYDIIKTDD